MTPEGKLHCIKIQGTGGHLYYLHVLARGNSANEHKSSEFLSDPDLYYMVILFLNFEKVF
jgi:hypothetical protein